MIPGRPGRVVPRQWPLRRWVRTVGWIGAVALLLVFGVGGASLARLNADRTTLVDELDPALIAAQGLNSALVNQETGVRGFASTGDPAFLQPYRDGLALQDRVVSSLRGLAATDPRPELTTGLDDVLGRARAWQQGFAEPTIAAVTARGPAGALDPGLGKRLFDTLRDPLTAQRSRLNGARLAARARLDEAAGWLFGVAIAIAVGLVVLFGLAALWARRIVLNPIRALADEVQVVADGAFDRPVTTEGPREVVALADDIDSMRARINGELASVQELNSRLDGLNRQLAEQTADLARSNSDLEQFAYVASHDLQEPLRKVSAFCELLAKRYGGQLDDRADQYIGFAVDGARRMSALINDLLAFSRVGRTTGRETWKEISAEELLDQAERNLVAAISDAGATVTRDALPTVVGETSLLVTVFQNLVGNGVKFHGEDPPVVHVGVRRDGGFWEFRVADNGIGIDPDYAERIFVIFQRLHAKAAYPGTGIGLALCRKIVDYHGGRIWLDDQATSGTAFCFTLPAPAPDPRLDSP